MTSGSKDGPVMSTEIRPDRSSLSGGYGNVRFRPRDGPPDPLHGPPRVNYPGHDGRPLADNTLQLDWIIKIRGGLDTLFRDRPDVFVAGNLMWYPVKGYNRRRLAPDAMVIFGRPKGYRTAYIQHREAGIGPQVVFEILSPSNGKRAMDYKRKIYELYCVEEYYVFNPYKITLEVWIREGDAFRLVAESNGFVSPRLGIRFELGEDLTIHAPDDRPFLDYAEVAHERDEQRQRADEQRQRADEQRQRADEEHRQRIESDLRAERLAAKLRALGLNPDE